MSGLTYFHIWVERGYASWHLAFEQVGLVAGNSPDPFVHKSPVTL